MISESDTTKEELYAIIAECWFWIKELSDNVPYDYWVKTTDQTIFDGFVEKLKQHVPDDLINE